MIRSILVCLLFFTATSCSLSPLDTAMLESSKVGGSAIKPQGPSSGSGSSLPETGNDSDGSGSSVPESGGGSVTPPPAVMPNFYYVEVWFKGESSSRAFVQNGDVYAYGVEVQIMHLDRVYASYMGNWWSGDGSHQLYGFSDSTGNNFNLKRYLKSDDMKTPAGSSSIHLYYWIKNMAYSFGRDNLRLTVPVDRFDPAKHTNIARYTVTTYRGTADPRPDLIVFDGFAPL